MTTFDHFDAMVLARQPRSARLRHQRRYAQRLGIAEPWVEPPRRGAQARFGNVR